MTSIGEWAFNGCTSLTSINIPDSVTSIGSYAFSVCTSLTNINIPNNVTSIGVRAFQNCTSLSSITISDSMSSIGEFVFYNCTSLKSVTISDSVTSIGGYAFSGCTSLTSINIPDSVTSIGSSAFSGCTSLTSINADAANNNYSSIDGVLYNKDISTLICCPGGKTSINIPDSVTSIDGLAFRGSTSLTTITIPDGVTSIEGRAFSGCTSLTSLTIPDSVTSIGRYAFEDCTSLTSVTIPDSVTSIGWGAFENCTSLTSITIPGSVTSIDDRAFRNCTSLTNITIPNSVTSIGIGAFEYCTSLTSITIPNSVTSIEGYAFDECTNLKSITIPDSVTSIGSRAFGYYYDNEYKKVEGFTIYGKTGSAAEQYAKDNGFTFIDPDLIVNVTKIKLNKTAVTLEKGKTETLTATVQPTNATDKTLTWQTTDKKVATVKDGKITAVGAGICTVFAKSTNGKKGSCTVTVTAPAPLVNGAVVSSELVQVGDKVRISGSAAGGAGSYTYAYYYKRSTNTKWRTLGTEFGTNSSVTFTPTAEADFDVKVVVKDGNGTTAEKLFTVKAVSELALTNVSALQRTNVKLGTSIPILGKAVGGAGEYKYAFYFKRSTNSKWNVLGTEFGTETTAKLKPTAAVSYDIRVIVKDKSGKTATKQFTTTVK